MKAKKRKEKEDEKERKAKGGENRRKMGKEIKYRGRRRKV